MHRLYRISPKSKFGKTMPVESQASNEEQLNSRDSKELHEEFLRQNNVSYTQFQQWDIEQLKDALYQEPKSIQNVMISTSIVHLWHISYTQRFS